MSDKPKPCGQFTSQDHSQFASGEMEKFSPNRAEKLKIHRGTCRYCDEGIASVENGRHASSGEGAKGGGRFFGRFGRGKA